MFGWNRKDTSKTSSEKRLVGLQEIGGVNNSNRKGDVIFVHGLGGNARSTWHPEERQDDHFWLNWLSQDHVDIGIWSFGYETEPFNWKGSAMPLFDQASNLLEWIEIKGIGEKPIVFVTHSLGGLLVKKTLNTAQTFKKQKIIEQIKGIVFLATPHTGSHLANLISNVGALSRTTISVEELKAHSPQLRELNDWYRENVRTFDIATKVYYETRSIASILVVDQDSANPGIEGVKPVAVEEDHITIAKPSSRNNLVYIGIESFILDCFKASRDNSKDHTVRFEILQGFILKDGIGAIEAKMIELTQTQQAAKFEIKCSWLESIEQQIDTLKAKAVLSEAEDQELLQATKLRNDLLDKVERVAWMLETLLNNETLKESSAQNGQHLNARHFALCLQGIIEIENYTAYSLNDWGIFRRFDKTGWTLYLSEQQKESMERCYYHGDERQGVSKYEAYSIAHFLTEHFAQRVLSRILNALSHLSGIKSDSQGTAEFLDMTTWYFGKDVRADLLTKVD